MYFHLKNVVIIISCSRYNFFQNAENGQGNLCTGRGKSQGTFFKFLVGTLSLLFTIYTLFHYIA